MIAKRVLGILTLCVISLAALAEQGATKAATENAAVRLYGKVVETMDAGNYTYVQVANGEKKYWAAGPKTTLKKGDMISFESDMPYTNFESKALGRTFDTIYFVSSFNGDKLQQPTGAAANPHGATAMADPHSGVGAKSTAAPIKDVKKAEGGKTIAEIFSEKDKLAGKSVKVRAQVVKYTPQVMGVNWLHVQDGSSDQRLVVTTDGEAKLGDLVLVNGVLSVNKDLGYGYVYEVLLEKAEVSVGK